MVVLMVGALSLRGDAIVRVASEAAMARMEKRMLDLMMLKLLLRISFVDDSRKI